MQNHIDFSLLRRPSSPNYYIACPQDKCAIKPDYTTKVYPVTMQELKQLWSQVIKTEPRFKLVKQDADDDQGVYVQRSALFRFPDYITVRFYNLGDKTSSLSLFSQARYGYYDFGVNKRRVLRLLKKINNRLEHNVKK